MKPVKSTVALSVPNLKAVDGEYGTAPLVISGSFGNDSENIELTQSIITLSERKFVLSVSGWQCIEPTGCFWLFKNKPTLALLKL